MRCADAADHMVRSSIAAAGGNNRRLKPATGWRDGVSTDDNALREANIAHSRAMFSAFTPFEPGWVAGLHPDIVMEFPFGQAVGLPAQVAGKDHCAGLFQLVATKLGLTFSDIEILGMADPNMILAQYNGEGVFAGKPYRQKYITLLRFQGEQLVLYREFVDTQVVADAFGHLSAIV